MRESLTLLRQERRAAAFFGALTQSSLGTGAGHVALLLIAYERLESPWAISLVLAADLVPAMLLGPLFGAVADRFSRRSCTVVADCLRAIAFIGIAMVDGLLATVALAGLAGIGTGLFTPAALASLPSLVEPRRLPCATALYSAVADLGYIAGPALAALLLVLGSPSDILLFNGVTFAMSALVLRLVPFGAVTAAEASPQRLAPRLLRDAREGIRAAAGLTGLRTILFASSMALFFVGAFNVCELLLVSDTLGAGAAEFGLLAAVFGLGFMAGSMSGAGGGSLPALKRRFLSGLAVLGVGFLAAGLSSTVAMALVAFAVSGFGNGLVIVYERLLIQALVPDALAGRVFGMKDSLSAWAFGLAFLAAGALVGLVGVRGTLLLAGVGGLLAWTAAAAALRRTWSPPVPAAEAAPAV
jgi:MFS family permease